MVTEGETGAGRCEPAPAFGGVLTLDQFVLCGQFANKVQQGAIVLTAKRLRRVHPKVVSARRGERIAALRADETHAVFRRRGQISYLDH